MSRMPLPRHRFALHPISVAACLLGGAQAAFALPQGAVPTFGQTTVNQTAPGQLNIQQGTQRAGIDWTSFSIAAGERVVVQQPSSSSVLLNRVLGSDPSQIYGRLQSNGSVWLINPRGIVFGPGSQVDVGGLVASTLSITNQDLASGRLVLGSGADGAGAITAAGRISAPGGTVVLAAPQLTQTGSIDARRIGLVAATDVQVDVEGDGLIFFDARNDGSLPARLSLLGSLNADGGSAEVRAAARAGFADTVLNLEGVVRARSIGARNGRIVIDGGSDGITRVAGTLDASGAKNGEHGGDVVVLGQQVLLDNGATVDASGAAGGGRIRVGGDFQGKNPELHNAQVVAVASGAVLSADASERGDGGRVVVWSDDATRFLGSASARGGPNGGNGGQAEVSGKGYLDYRGSVDLTSPLDQAGTLLLDPSNITIVANTANSDINGDGNLGDDINNTPLGVGTSLLHFSDYSGKDSIISAAGLQTQLASGTVELQASGDINVNAAVSSTGSKLTLRANGNINVTQSVSVTGGVAMYADNDANAAGSVAIATSADVTAGASSTVTISTGSTATNTVGAKVTAGTIDIIGDTTLGSAGILKAPNVTLSSGRTSVSAATNFDSAATISVASAATLNIGGGASVANAVTVNAGTIGNTSGAGTLSGNVTLGGNSSLSSSGTGLTVSGVIDDGAGTFGISTSGNVTLSGTNTYGGATTVSSGTLTLASNAAAGTGSIAVGAGTLNVNASVANAVSVNAGTIGNTSGTGTLSGNVTLGGNSSLSSSGTGLTVSGVIDDGAGTFGIGTSGNVTLSGTNTYGGATTVSSGTLTLASNAAAGTGSIAVGASTLNITNAASIANTVTVSSGGSITSSAGGGTLAAGSALSLANGVGITLSSANAGTLTVARVISDSSNNDATVAVAGNVAFTSDNSYGGGTTVAAIGTLTLGNGGAAGSAGSGDITLGNGATLGIDRDNSATFTLTQRILGASAGNGTLAQAGTGTTVLTGANSYGVTSITNGTLQVGSGGGSGTLGSGGVSIASPGRLVVDRSGTFTIAGALSGDGALNQSGSGTTALTAANGGYSGAITVSAGTLQVSGGSANAGTGLITLGANTLDIANGATVTNSLTAANGANITSSTGNGTLGTLGTSTVTLPDAATLKLSSDKVSDTLTVNSVIDDGANTANVSITAGTVVLNAANTYSGSTHISHGAKLVLGSGATTGSGPLDIGSGVFDIKNGATYANAILSGGGTIANSNGTGTLSGLLTIYGGTATTLESTGAGLTLSGGIAESSAGQGITITGSGTVTLTTAGTYTGTTTVSAGTLALGASNAFATGNALVVNGGTLSIGATSQTLGSVSLQSGSISGSGVLTSGTDFDLQGGNANVVLAGSVGLNKTGSGSATLGGANTYTGTTTVSAGTLVLGADNVLPGAVLVNGGTLDIGTHSDTIASLSLQGGSVTGSTGVLTSSTDVDAQSGSIGAILGGTIGLTKSTAGSVSLGGANTYTGTTTVSAGTLVLGADNVLPGAVLVNGGTLDIGTHSDTITSLSLQGGSVTGSTGVLTSSTDVDAQSGSIGAILGGSAGLVKTGAASVTLGGANSYTGSTAVNAGTLVLNAADRLANSDAVSVATGATLTLNGNDQIASLVLAGSLGGTGTLTAATYTLNSGSVDAGAGLGAGTLTSNGASALAGTAAANVNVATGTLTLAAADRIANTAAVGVASGATLALNGDDTVASLSLAGTLAGSGTLSAASYTLTGGSANANLGAGTLTSSGSSTLAGTSGAATVNVTGGTLTLGAANRLADSASVGVATGATLALNGDDTVGSLALSGTLSGSGTLTAATYALTGGTATASLGAGTLTSTGTSTLAGTSGAATVNVSSGTLTLNAANLLADTAAVGVASGATLALGGDDSVGSLALSGTLGGSGTLTAATYALGGGTANANLGAGALSSVGVSALNGTAGASTVDVTAGTLTLGGTVNRLSPSAAVTVASGAALTLLADNSVASLSLSGSLNGPGTLNASSYLLNGGTYNSNLGTGSLTTTGNSVLNGTSAATSVLVDSGSLTLGSAGRLIGIAPTVSVNGGAALNLGGDETIGSLTLAGTLGGSGTLTASSYTLAGGSANAGLGGGALSGFGTLNGQAAVDSLAVSGGALTLGPASVLSGTPAVSIASGSTLALVADSAFASLTGSGNLALGSYTLRAGSAGASTFDGVIAGTGALVKQGSGTFTLAGANTYSGGTAVEAGTLALASANRLADTTAVTVAPGATLQLGGDDTVASLSLAGTLSGTGTLSAASYTLNGGSANANLGGGTLTSSGSSTLAGTLAADTLSVDSGTLTLVGANRLADSTAVTVAAGATLALGGDDTVAHLVLRGALGGSGTLSAATYAIDGGVAGAGLGAGALTSTGASRLDGGAAITSVNVDSGTLTLGGANRFGAAPTVTVAAGASVALGGDEIFGSLAGSGAVGLGPATLSVGDASSSVFAGVIGGSGGLVKQGSGDLALTGANVYTGLTHVAAGSLTLGDGGSSGSLASASALLVDGTLRSNRADAVNFAQVISGSGGVDQIGSGTLTLAGGNKSYTGATRALAGRLATAGDEQIPDASDVSVAAGARLTLGGTESVNSIVADGSVDIASRLTSAGAMTLNGAVSVIGGAAVTLVGQQISATNDANQWGSSLSVQAGGQLALSSGRDGSGALHDLVLGQVSAAAGGEIDAGAITLSDSLAVGGGTLALVSSAPAVITQPDSALLGKLAPGNRQIAFAGDVVQQTGGAITVADGAGLDVVAANGGSVQLLADGNLFSGSLAVRSGAANSPWAPNPTTASFGGPSFEYSLQSRVRVNGSTVNVGGAGIEADVVAIRADKLSTATGATIVARLPFDNQVGTTTSEPGLALELAPAAFQTAFPFGKGSGGEIAINVGSQSWGNRALAINGGYLAVLPKGGAQGATAVILMGPKVIGSYSFFFDGAGDQSAIPVFYNGVLPSTPQVAGSLSAIASVSESARKERFEEAVRTENVSVRLRAGVIAEVGPGRPATVGTEGAREPDSCTPEGATLGCGKGSK